MCIPEFWAGVVACVFCEFALLVVGAMVTNIIITAKDTAKDKENEQ